MRSINLAGIFVIISVGLISCAPRPQMVKETEGLPTEKVVFINNMTFAGEVVAYDGFALVLFYNTQFWQSKDMERRFEYFADRFHGKGKFCKFHWPMNADTMAYRLEMLPTVVLYDRGAEIDRIKGIPPDEKTRKKWNDDIELWFLKNVLDLKGDEYAGEYTYLFRNSYKLHIGNY